MLAHFVNRSKALIFAALLGTLCAVNAHAERSTVCTVTVNSPDEREIFRKLELQGLKRIAASGAFSPAIHEALMRVETDKTPEGEIVAEMRPGYTLHEKVLRPAQVSVAAKPQAKP